MKQFNSYRQMGLMTVALLCLAFFVSACATTDTPDQAAEVDWRQEVIYFAFTDRFNNGDTSNDDGAARPGAGDEVDRGNPLGWHGGDFAGIQAKIEEGYFERLGVTALWISPVYLQVPAITAEDGDGPNIGRSFAGYHGYWAEDFLEVDPHFGTLEELKELVEVAHENDLKIIQDMVVNHAGYGASLVEEEPAWLPERPRCYEEGVETEIDCELAGLPDFDQGVSEAAAFLDETVTYWRDEVGIDGIRMDTVKHVPDSYWDAFFNAGAPGDPDEVWTVGEIFSGDIPFLANYLDTLDVPAVFDFPLYFRIKDHLTSGGGNLNDVAVIFDQDSTYDDPSRLVTFVDNHDVRRFMSESVERGVPEAEARERLDLALSLIFTSRGTPMVYQGTEIAQQGLGDPYDYELGKGNREDMDFSQLETSQLDERIGVLAEARATYPALTQGEQQMLSRPSENGQTVMAYRRTLDDETVVVVLNNGDAEVALADLNGGGIRLLGSLSADAELTEVTGRASDLSVDAQGRLVGTVPARTLLAVAGTSGGSGGTNADLADVTGLSALGGSGAARLTWTPVDDAEVTGYRVYYREVGAETFVRDTFAPLPVDAESQVVYGLTNGTTYDFKVVSVDQNGAESTGTATTSATPNEEATTSVTFTVDARSQGDAQLEIRRFDTGSEERLPMTAVTDRPGFWEMTVELPFLREIVYKFGNAAPDAVNSGYEGAGTNNRVLLLDDLTETVDAVFNFGIDVPAPASSIRGQVTSGGEPVAGANLSAATDPAYYYALTSEDGSYYLPLPEGTTTELTVSAPGFESATVEASAGDEGVDVALEPAPAE